MRNLEAIVNKILSESFETGELNATAAGPGIHPAKRGGVERQMIAGEMVSSPAYFFQVPVADTHQKLTSLLDAQSKAGLGEMVGIGQSVNDFVEAYLEDTAVEMYTNPNNVEYLINSLQESGYTEYASALDAITLNPTIDDVGKLNEMVEVLGKDPRNEYFVESIIFIAEQIVDENSTPANDGDNQEDTTEERERDQSEDDNSGSGEPSKSGETKD